MNTRNDKNTIAQTRANMQIVHNILNGGTEVNSEESFTGQFELAA